MKFKAFSFKQLMTPPTLFFIVDGSIKSFKSAAYSAYSAYSAYPAILEINWLIG